MFLTLSQRKVWSNALMCLGSSAEPSSPAKTAADQFDWSHMAFIRAVITSFYGVFYSEDRTVISLTHIPTARLGLVLLWFGVCRHGSNNTADTQTCCSLSETVTGLQSRKTAEWSWSSPNTDVTGRKKLPDCVKLSDGLTTSTALCLIRSVFFKDVLDKDVTRSFCMVNPSRAGSNYRLHWASRMQQTLTAPFFEGWFCFFF